MLRHLRLLIIIALIIGIEVSLKPAGVAHAEGPNAILYLTGCDTNTLLANDDSSTPQLNLPFSLDNIHNSR